MNVIHHLAGRKTFCGRAFPIILRKFFLHDQQERGAYIYFHHVTDRLHRLWYYYPHRTQTNRNIDRRESQRCFSIWRLAHVCFRHHAIRFCPYPRRAERPLWPQTRVTGCIVWHGPRLYLHGLCSFYLLVIHWPHPLWNHGRQHDCGFCIHRGCESG